MKNPGEGYFGQNPKEQNCCEKGSASETKTQAVKLPAQLSPCPCSSTCCPSATTPLNWKNFSQFATRINYLDHRHRMSCGLLLCQGILGRTKAFSQVSSVSTSDRAWPKCLHSMFWRVLSALASGKALLPKLSFEFWREHCFKHPERVGRNRICGKDYPQLWVGEKALAQLCAPGEGRKAGTRASESHWVCWPIFQLWKLTSMAGFNKIGFFLEGS